jgi:hypothetical protein
VTGRRRQLRYQLAPAPRRPRTSLPPAPGTMIAGPDTIWREPRQPPAGPEYPAGKQAREQPQRLKLHRSNLHTYVYRLKASGYADRATGPDVVRYASVECDARSHMVSE